MGGDKSSGEQITLLNTECEDTTSKPRVGSKGSFLSAYYNLLHTAIGAGVLNMAASFSLAGVIEVIILEAIVVLISGTTLYILVQAQNRYQVKEYFSLLEHSYNKKLRIVAQIMVIVYSFGACVIYLKVLGEQAQTAMHALLGAQWYTSHEFLISMCALIIAAPLSALPKMEWLEWSSGFGVGAIVVVAVMVCASYIWPDAFGKPFYDEPVKPPPMFTSSVLNAVGAVVALSFAFQCHISSNTIYASMANPTPGRFLKVITLVLVTCFIVYTLVGLFGSLKFGTGPTGAQSDILLNYDALGYAVAAARILVAISVATAYPLCLFVGRQGIETFVTEYAPRAAKYARAVFVTETVVWLLLSCLLAIFVRSIGEVIDFIGNIAALFMFTFPGMLLLQLLKSGYDDLEGSGLVKAVTWPRLRRVYAWFLIGFGVVIAILGIVRMFVHF